MLRVLYLINFAGKAGSEKYVENLVRVLDGTAIEAHLAYGVPGALSEKLEGKGVPCLRLELSWARALGAARRLAAYCREHKIDVIHAQFPRENIIALLSKRFYPPVRVVMTSHLTLTLSGLSGALWRTLNRRFTPKNHRVIALYTRARDLLIQNGVAPSKIAVIYNGVEPGEIPARPRDKRRELGLSEDCFVISILARLSPEKGLDFLLDALDALRGRAQRPFCCLICGDGERLAELSQRRAALGLESCCRLLGFRSDTRDILLASDAYVCSSQSGEAMSFAILEAMDCALPLVVTDVGGNAELCQKEEDCGFVVPYGDTQALAERLLLLMGDPALCARYGAAAREKVKTCFDLDKLIWDVYETYF